MRGLIVCLQITALLLHFLISSAFDTHPAIRRPPARIDQPYTWPGYRDLPACLKWCFSGCRGPKDMAAECVKMFSWQTNADYKGFASISGLGCTMPGCLCGDSASFMRSVQKVYNCSFPCCQPYLRDLGRESPDFKNMIKVVSSFCEANELPQPGWADVVLTPPASTINATSPMQSKYSNLSGVAATLNLR